MVRVLAQFLAISIVTLVLVEGLFQLNAFTHFIVPPELKYPKPSFRHADWLRDELQRIDKKVPASLIRQYSKATNAIDYDDLDQRERFPQRYDFDHHSEMQSKLSIRKTGEVIYDVVYSFDVFGRRKVNTQRPGARKFLFAVGDSFTIGEGVQQEEAYPAQLARLLPHTQVYNMGWHGFGPNDILYRLQKKEPFYLDGIRQSRGSLIYLVLPSHIDRIIGPSSAFTERNDYILYKPFYELGEDDRPIFQGFFRQDRPIENLFLKAWAKSAFFNFFNLNWPLYTTNSHLHLFTSHLKAIRSSFAQRFKIESFYILLWPGMPADVSNFLERELEAPNFKMIDISTLNFSRISAGQFNLPGDGHPTPAAYWILSRLVAQELDTGER